MLNKKKLQNHHLRKVDTTSLDVGGDDHQLDHGKTFLEPIQNSKSCHVNLTNTKQKC